jgi:ketosteroid isomerase-like protein
MRILLPFFALALGWVTTATAQQRDTTAGRDTAARRDSLARADSIARADSMRVERELKRIRNEPRARADTLIRPVAPAAPGGRAAATAADSAAVAEVVERFHRALAAGDSTGALSLLAPDVVILESGHMETKEDYRVHHLSADIAFARAVKGVRRSMRVAVRGDVAWASSTGTIRGKYRGRRLNSTGAELMVLTRGSGGWEIVAIHWSSRPRRA